MAKRASPKIDIEVTYADGASPESVRACYWREWGRAVGAEIKNAPPENRRPLVAALREISEIGIRLLAK